MKIGIFSDSYVPYTSGVVRSIEIFIKELRLMNNEVFIFAPHYPNCADDEYVYRFFSVPSPTYEGFYLAVPFSIKIWSVLKKLNLDIIHVHSPFLLGKTGARYAKKLGIPLVFTYHTLYEKYVHYMPFAKEIAKTITKKMVTNFCNRCNHIIAPTDAIKEYLYAHGVNIPITTIPTGIPSEYFTERDRMWLRKKYQIPSESKVLLFVGRLGKEKNIDFLLDMHEAIIKSNYNAVLVIVGDGPYKQELKNKVYHKGLENKVIFTRFAV